MILSVRRPWRRWISSVVVLACLTLQSHVLGAQEINDCKAADRFLKKAVEQANHCRHAGECITVEAEGHRTVGCGLLFNEAERPAVESAIATYARLCGPHWHCLSWTVTHEIACIRNRCEWRRRSRPSMEDLRNGEGNSSREVQPQ